MQMNASVTARRDSRKAVSGGTGPSIKAPAFLAFSTANEAACREAGAALQADFLANEALDPLFEAVAGVLNRGTAQLLIVAYGDPTDPDDGILALSRAGHVREHLLELGVDPTRLVVESRPPLEATAGTDPALVERRTDLEFAYRS